MKIKLLTYNRHSLVGMNLDSGNGNFCYKNFSRVTSSLLAKSNINFVIKVMEERCGKCGILNDGPKLNTHPWIVALRESPPGGVTKYRTGTLVSRQWVVTEASIFVNIHTATENFEVLVGAKAFQNNANDRWEPISEVKRHPKYNYRTDYKYDVAMVKLKTRILDPVPHPSDVKYDTIRPVCLPDYASEDDDFQYEQLYNYHQLSDKILFNSRLLTAKKAKITPNDECQSTLSSIATPVTVQEYVFIYFFDITLIQRGAYYCHDQCFRYQLCTFPWESSYNSPLCDATKDKGSPLVMQTDKNGNGRFA